MAKRQTARSRSLHGELRVRGTQREQLEADLLAQIVVMLGRQLSAENEAAKRAPSDAVTRSGIEEVVS